MKFLYHHRTLGRGGEGVHIASMVRALETLGHTIQVASPSGVDPLRMAGASPVDKGQAQVRGITRIWKFVSCWVPDIFFEILEIGYNVVVMIRLGPILLRRGQDVYYERYAFFMFMGVFLAKFFGWPVLLEVNEVVGVQRARNQVLVPVSQWFEKMIFKKADVILTVSSFLKEEVLKRGGKPGAVHVIPNAVDAQVIETTEWGDQIRKRYHLNGHTVVGFAGWFDTWDRLDLLIKAVGDVHKEYPHIRLMLVGNGPVVDGLIEQIRASKLEEVVFLTGPVPRSQVLSYIAAMDICVLPDSNVFGSPIVLFEFMGMGKAVIAPDLLPIRDIIEDRKDGLIVQCGDPGALRQALSLLLGDSALRMELGARARKKVLGQHTWHENGKKVERFASALIDQS
ncbi:MAG TPA: glycosyltransferase family 4 protein [Nitrospirales bacterium]|nr:glycosyltransferase family 4 protein [Nitrospirales bacterium]